MAKKSINQLMASTQPLDPEMYEWENRIKQIELKMKFVSESVETVKGLIEKNNKLIRELTELAKGRQATLPVPMMIQE